MAICDNAVAAMLERWPLSTLLLGTFTAWALLLALATAFGLGGRVQPHPANPGLAPALPTISQQVAETGVQPFSAYTEVVQRPLFSPDRRPQAVELADAGSDAGTGDLTLTSVILTPQLRMALLHVGDSDQVLRVREGELLQGRPSWRLSRLSDRSAVLDGPDGSLSLELRVFDGRGGETPTRVSAPERAQQQTAAQRPDPQQVESEASASPADATTTNARERAEEIRRRIEARREQLREQAQRRQEAQEE